MEGVALLEVRFLNDQNGTGPALSRSWGPLGSLFGALGVLLGRSSALLGLDLRLLGRSGGLFQGARTSNKKRSAFRLFRWASNIRLADSDERQRRRQREDKALLAKAPRRHKNKKVSIPSVALFLGLP